MEVRFAIGEVPKEFKRQIAEEERNFGVFLHIPVKVRCWGAELAGGGSTALQQQVHSCRSPRLAPPTATAPALAASFFADWRSLLRRGRMSR